MHPKNNMGSELRPHLNTDYVEGHGIIVHFVSSSLVTRPDIISCIPHPR